MFKPEVKPKVERITRPVITKLKYKRRITEQDVRRIYYYRHGQDEPTDNVVRTWEEIGRLLRLNGSSAWHAYRRYKNNGFKYVDKSKLNFRKGWETNRKIRGSDVDYLLSQDTLQRWAGYSL